MVAHTRIFLLLMLCWISLPAIAGDILKQVTFKDKGDRVEIRAELGTHVDYVKHFPSTRGKIVQIQIKVVGKEFDDRALRRRETIEPGADAPVGVRDIIYEGNVRGGPFLVFRFPVVTSFSLGKEKNASVITIEVEKEKLAEAPVITAPVVSTETPSATDSETDVLMQEGRAALTRGENTEAILKFAQILQMPANKNTQDAREYLGLARERNGQLEMAKNEYEEYLKLYPDTPKTNTVRQRLMTLNVRLTRIERELKEGKRQREQRTGAGTERKELFGRVSQLIYNANLKQETGDSEWVQRRLLTFVDITNRWRDPTKEMRLSFSGTNDADFLSNSSSSASRDTSALGNEVELETRIRSAFAEYKGKENGIHASVGRQSINSGGVLGRFDGAMLGYEFKKNRRIYGVFGAPVDYQNHDQIQTNKPVVGGRIEIDDLIPNWKGSVYAIQQQVDGVLDRRAVGGDARYFQKDKIFYALLDYDVSYNKLNFATAHYGWQMNEKTKFDIHLDSRRSPVMLTSNALKAINSSTQLYTIPDELKSNTNPTIADMLQYFSEAEIRKIAMDYTGSSALYTFGMTRDLPKDTQLITNITASSYKAGYAEQLTDTQDPETVDPRETIATQFIPSDLDWIFSAQLVRRNWFVDREIVLAGARVSTNDRNQRASVNVTLRRPYKEKWWLDLRGRVMYTKNLDSDTNSARLSPSLRVEYRWNKKMTLEGEVGSDINRSQVVNEDYVWTYGNFGYRYFF